MSTQTEHLMSLRAARQLRQVRDGLLATASVGPPRTHTALGHPYTQHAAP
ncbi:hypothetical protein ACFV0D_09295 [Streptomyces sp. NPDC059556]